MQRVRLAWLVAISLMSAGSLAAHSLTYRLVAPDRFARADLLATTGHGYLAALPTVLAACCAVAIAALVGMIVRGTGRPSSAALRPCLAVLPLLGFALQEHIERLLAGYPVVGTALEPSFLVGIALQIPFAAAALLAARFLCSAADSIARALASPPRPRAYATQSSTMAGADVRLPRFPALALGSSSRGPPSASRP